LGTDPNKATLLKEKANKIFNLSTQDALISNLNTKNTSPSDRLKLMFEDNNQQDSTKVSSTSSVNGSSKPKRKPKPPQTSSKKKK
jgi:hypothetical protein